MRGKRVLRPLLLSQVAIKDYPREKKLSPGRTKTAQVKELSADYQKKERK